MIDRTEQRRPRPMFNQCPLCQKPIAACKEHYGNGGRPFEEIESPYIAKMLSSDPKAIAQREYERIKSQRRRDAIRLKGGNRKRAFEGRHVGNSNGVKHK